MSQRKRLRRVDASTSTKLHLGCGGVAIPGFCNVDVDPHTAADIVDDISTLEKFPNGHADLVYACHVLEHLPLAEVATTLGSWHRVLRPGGEVFISVPDLDRIVQIYASHLEHFQTRPNNPWLGLIYGGQVDRFDFHRTGFNLAWVSELLERAGFRDVREYPHLPHPFGVVDASLADAPFGEFVSLNVVAVRN
jgi:predicted SAM-dependent methyltransferase